MRNSQSVKLSNLLYKSFEDLVESGVDVGAGERDFSLDRMLTPRRRRLTAKQKRKKKRLEEQRLKAEIEREKKEAEIAELMKSIPQNYWYQIGTITQNIPSPTHKRQLYSMIQECCEASGFTAFWSQP